MFWRNQARKRTVTFSSIGDCESFDEDFYEIVEVIVDKDGNIEGWTESEVTIYSNESKQALADWLRKAADDIEKYDLIDETEEVVDG